MSRELLPLPGDAVPTPRDTLRARFMFTLAFAHLLVVAGLIHRATSKSVTVVELDVMYAGLLALWPVFVAEAIWGIRHRDRAKPGRPVFLRAVLVALMPPWRMALADPRTGLIWVPRIGWQPPGKELFKRLEVAFGGPMLLFAFLILPILILEYLRGDIVRDTAALTLALDLGIAVVWVAFATEFVFKASAHPKPFGFAQERWLDVAIVVLPMLEFVLTKWVDAAPLARLLRAGRALSPEQLARMQRLYRLQGLATKAWQAVLLLGVVNRLLGNTPEKRLAQLEEKIADLEEQLKEAKEEAEELKAKIAARESAGEPTPRPPPCREGEKEPGTNEKAHEARSSSSPFL
jgi:hypothetical protein